MTNNEAIKIIENEKACVLRADSCSRECGVCDLLLPTEDILEAYDTSINIMKQLANNDKE